MCSTCNYKNYIKEEKLVNGAPVTFLKGNEPFLDINCDINGSNFKIGSFVIYHCPTCGRKLY